MRRTRIGIAAGVGLTAVLATGWLVLAQAPSRPGSTKKEIATAQQIVPAGALPTPPPAPNWQLSQAPNPPQPLPAPVSVVPSPAPAPATVPPKTNGDLVQELIQIINETRSVDTFFVTTKLLEDMGSRSRVAVPAIIRNAERLDLFKDSILHTEKDGYKQKKVELNELIVDALTKIMGTSQGGATPRPPVGVTPVPLIPPATKRDPADPLVTPTSGRPNGPPSVSGSSLR